MSEDSENAQSLSKPALLPPTDALNSSETAPSTHFSTHSTGLHRPFRFFHPTRAQFSPRLPEEILDVKTSDFDAASHWSSRASRKNRYTPDVVHVRHHPLDSENVPSEVVLVEQRLRHPTSKIKVHLTWDISFWVAVLFVIGSTVWVVNGFYLLLPLMGLSGEHITAASWWAFAGGSLFEVGSYLMLVESLNTGHDELFGPALWGLVSHKQTEVQSLDGKDSRSNGDDGGGRSMVKFRWIGVGSWRDLGFLACFIQVLAATIFWISTITGLPHVISNLTTAPSVPIADVFYWSPQVIGGSGFIISSLLLMLEVQTAWWKPNLFSLGWHVAVWNLIGAIGFTLCGALGYASLSSSKADYQSVLCTFWGSWAFLIGSVVQQWETLWREDPKSGITTP